MENLSLNSNNSNCPLVREFLISNLRQLSITLKNLAKDNKKNDSKFSLEIFCFKKITKLQCIIIIYINESPYKIVYEYLGASKDSLKKLKKELIGNFMEEVIENFEPLESLIFHSDNRNNAGLYTMKYLIKNYKILKHLNLENIFFPMDEKIKIDSNLINNESILHYSNLKSLDNLQVLSLNFIQSSQNENFMDKFYTVLNSCFTIKTLKKINFKFFSDTWEINFPQISEKSIIKLKSVFPIFQFDEIKISFVNTNLLSKNSFKQSDLLAISIFFFENLIPEFLELNFVDILSNKNSEIEEKLKIFRYSKLIYSKKFFCILNSFRNFLIEKKYSKVLNISNFSKIQNSLNKFLYLKPEEIFEIKTNHLQIMIPEIQTVNSKKFLFNLINDYESILKRKIKYEEIYNLITVKTENDEPKLTNIKLKQFDLNTFSKILNKIDANSTLVLQDGTFISIGGKFKKITNQGEYLKAINTIIIANRNFSELKIITFNDRILMSHFSSAAQIIDEENLLLVGGMSQQELIPNFVDTPIYKLNFKNFNVKRILPSKENKLIPGLIFNHQINITGKLMEVYGGMVVKNYKGGLNILEDHIIETPKIEVNNNIFVFDLEKLLWTMKSNN
jgi:hypothetical protein